MVIAPLSAAYTIVSSRDTTASCIAVRITDMHAARRGRRTSNSTTFEGVDTAIISSCAARSHVVARGVDRGRVRVGCMPLQVSKLYICTSARCERLTNMVSIPDGRAHCAPRSGGARRERRSVVAVSAGSWISTRPSVEASARRASSGGAHS